jgi:hypothetical protein
MRIGDARFPIEPAWEGTLAPPKGVFAPPGEKLPTVSIGRPVWWDSEEILGEKWTQPARGNRYGLARFAFSLRPEGRKVVRRAELMVSLETENGGGAPVIFDLLPKVTTEEKTGTFKATVGLDFKFLDLAKAGTTIETTIDLHQEVPVIVADGIGESIARWVFVSGRAHPLVGSQIVYAVLGLPAGTSAARASLHLSAEVATSLGPIRGILPKEASEQLSWVLKH